MINKFRIALLLPVSLIVCSLSGQSVAFSGEVIGWSVVNPGEPFQLQGGARYIPALNFSVPAGSLIFEGEGSVDMRAIATYTSGDSLSASEKISPYRLWLKLSGDRFEVRAGLQKINFGSATMIRPLMWFDQLDPKDPLQLTTGVYGLLGRYYFQSNANIWLWGLCGNNQRKGLELFPTKKNSVEFGGRFQLPFSVGEVAATYHHRQADIRLPLTGPVQVETISPENRYAIDAKVDLGVGVWFEGALIQQNSGLPIPDNATLLNAGMDYTFNIGSGLHLMGEGLCYMQDSKPFGADQKLLFGGVSANYPINIIHSISAILFIDATNKEFYRFLNWSMTFDRWTFYTMAFWNPERYLLPGFEQEGTVFSGAGFQLMAVFNH